MKRLSASVRIEDTLHSWRPTTAGEICTLITKGTTPRRGFMANSGNAIPFLRVQNLTFEGKLSTIHDLVFVDRETNASELARSRVFPGDLLINIVGPPLGKVGIVPDQYPEWNMNQAIAVFRTGGDCSGQFLSYYLQSATAKNWLLSQSKKTSGQLNLTLETCSALPIRLPPISEQKMISAILGAWDEALEKFDALIAAKDRRKKALMQQLLTGKRRLPSFNKPWTRLPFGDIMRSEERYVEFDDNVLYRLVSARRRADGVFFREALHGRDIKTKVMKQVRAGDLIISRMQVVHGGLGLVTPECDGFYASDSYEVLVPRDPKQLDYRFIGHLSRCREFWHRTYICSHGVHIEKMTFVVADFEKEKFDIPSELAEQKAICNIVDAVDVELRLLRQQRAALDQQKRGLMQQLLTGKIRVKP